MKTMHYLTAISLVMFLLGCMDDDTGIDADIGVDPGVNIISESQAVQVTNEEFSWRQGNTPIPMGSSSDRFCFLTYIAGKFEGGGESVHVYVSDGSWWLGGASQQVGVAARARCVPLNWNGRSYGYTIARGWRQEDHRPTYLGTESGRTCMLTKVTGKFEGGGEWVEVYRSGGGWWLAGASQQKGVAAYARCLTNSSTSGPYHWSQKAAEKIMTPTKSWACGLTRMIGRFEGGGESLEIFQSGGSWYLGGTSQQAGVGASAHCMY